MVTKDNFSAILKDLGMDEIKRVLEEEEGDYIYLWLDICNTLCNVNIERGEYDSEREADVLGSGGLFSDIDGFLSLIKEFDSEMYDALY